MNAAFSALLCFLWACEPVGVDVVAPIQPVVVKEVKPALLPKDYCTGIPSRACPYLSYLLASSNPSREAAQTDQESGFRLMAKSPYAYGLRQFTPATGRHLARTLCKDLGPFRKYNARWQMECGLRYMVSHEKTSNMPGYCLNRKVAEQRYNGGYWVMWELKASNSISLVKARRMCGTRLPNSKKRAGWACKENYEYPERISKRQIQYQSLGGQLCV